MEMMSPNLAASRAVWESISTPMRNSWKVLSILLSVVMVASLLDHSVLYFIHSQLLREAFLNGQVPDGAKAL